MTIALDLEGRVTRLTSGVPWGGLYAVLEGVKGRLAEWFSAPSRLMESWASALVVSRAPWPYASTSERVFVEGVTHGVERHFWSSIKGFRQSLYTDSTVIGVATAWSPKLHRSAERVLATAQAILIPNKQYRVDLGESVAVRWAEVALV